MNSEDTDTPAPPPASIKEQAIRLLARHGTIKAKITAISAPFLAQVAIIQEALAKETAPLQEELDKIRVEAERIGLTNADEIFGEHHTSVISNGQALKLSESEAVACDDEALTIKRLLKEAGKAHLTAEPDPDEKGLEHRMAAAACLRIKIELNKQYVQSMYDDYAPWFQDRGISLLPSRSVKLTDAPKERPKKAAKKAKKAADAQAMEEAA